MGGYGLERVEGWLCLPAGSRDPLCFKSTLSLGGHTWSDVIKKYLEPQHGEATTKKGAAVATAAAAGKAALEVAIAASSSTDPVGSNVDAGEPPPIQPRGNLEGFLPLKTRTMRCLGNWSDSPHD